jgi:hypothetical protein
MMRTVTERRAMLARGPATELANEDAAPELLGGDLDKENDASAEPESEAVHHHSRHRTPQQAPRCIGHCGFDGH